TAASNTLNETGSTVVSMICSTVAIGVSAVFEQPTPDANATMTAPRTNRDRMITPRMASQPLGGAHLHFHRANPLDVRGDDVARLDRADAFRRTGDDDVAGIQRVERRGVLYKL